MKSDKFLNFILAIAIVILGSVQLVKSTQCTTPNVAPAVATPVDTGAIVFENILTRSSVREYTSQAVEKELLKKLVQAGMAAPTAMNKQPWKFVVISDKEAMKTLSTQLPYAKMLAHAPAAIAVLGDLNKALPGASQEYWIQDTSAATENILLAAHGFGLGAVWTGVYPNQDKIAAVRSALNIPDHLIPLCVIVIGYPAHEAKVKDKWLDENLIWGKF